MARRIHADLISVDGQDNEGVERKIAGILLNGERKKRGKIRFSVGRFTGLKMEIFHDSTLW
jgi:hypothetical protein